MSCMLAPFSQCLPSHILWLFPSAVFWLSIPITLLFCNQSEFNMETVAPCFHMLPYVA